MLWLLLLPALAPAQGHAQAPCRPAVALEGAGDLIEGLTTALRQRGVAGTPEQGCPLLRARVERRGPQVQVTLLERVSERDQQEFTGEDPAATFIESWARQDISGPLLSLALPPAAIAPTLPRPSTGHLTVTADGTLFGANDGSIWAGAELAGCARVGRVCLGALLLLRSHVFPAFVRASEPLNQLDAAVLLAAELPVRAGPIFIVPSLGLGAGFVHTRLNPNALLDRTDQGGLRIRLGVAVSVPLLAGVALDAGISGDLSVLNAGAVFIPGMPGMPAMPPMPDHPPIDVPAPPWGFLGAHLGLRWSGP